MFARINQKMSFFLVLLMISSSSWSFEGIKVIDVKEDISLANDSIVNKAKLDFEKFTQGMYDVLGDSTLNYQSFKYAAKGYFNLLRKNKVGRERYFTVIDFSKPSTEDRLYIIDLCYNKIAYKSIVAHGKNSGGLYANKFSNTESSHQSSIGFYLTTSTYHSSKYNLALRLDGLEYTNSNARSRGVVMHGAKYATYEFLKQNGVLGRSYGCPAMPYENFDNVVNRIKNGTCLFIYYPDKNYLTRSKVLNKKDYLSFFL